MAQLVFPTDQLVDWTANTHTGVIGGIPTGYTKSGSTITSTGSDQRAQINTALSSASAGQYVLLANGTFVIDGTITIPTGRVLRGSSQDGTILSITSGNKGVYCGSDSDYDIGGRAGDTVSAGTSRGSDTVTIADTSAYSVGEMLLIKASDVLPPDNPIISTTGQVNLRSQVVRIMSKTGTTITFFPSLHTDFSTATVSINRFTAQSINAGCENLTIDGEPAGTVQFGIQFEQTMDCWMTNVTSKGCTNYNAHLWHTLNNEIKGCVFGPLLHSGSNGAGLLHELSCQSLVANNIIFDSFPNLELWGSGNQGCAFAYNMMDITAGAGILWHNATDSYNVFEGNIASSVQVDGYFGTNNRGTFFRNWFFGIKEGIESGQPVGSSVSINRMTRYTAFVGNNQAGQPSFGNPNIGNGDSSGIAAPSSCTGTLTTRTNATSGVITGPSGHTVTTGATITIAWVESGGGAVQLAKIRRDVTVGTVSGTSIPFSGGRGDDLPPDESSVYIPTTNDALRVWWNQLDENGSTLSGSLTTRTDDTTGVFTVTGTGTIPSDNWPTSFRWAAGFRYQMTVDNVAGSAISLVSVNNPGGNVLPAVSTAGALYPGPNGFQELDLDCVITDWSWLNWVASGIPASQQTSDTLQDSLIFTSAPSWMAGYTFPFNPNSGTPDAADIPAGDRYLNGIDPEGPIINVTTLNVTNLVIG